MNYLDQLDETNCTIVQKFENYNSDDPTTDSDELFGLQIR